MDKYRQLIEDGLMDLTTDARAVPFDKIREIFCFLPYGHEMRVIIKWMGATGCRPSELNRMFIDQLVRTPTGWMMIWKLKKTEIQQNSRRCFKYEVLI